MNDRANIPTLPSLVEHRGYEIRVSERFTFHIDDETLRGDLNQYVFPALSDARYAIDNFLDRRAKENKAKQKIALPVLTPAGRRMVVTGIHASKSCLLPMEGTDSGVFPDVDWIRDLLERRVELQRQIQEITNTIKPFHINQRPLGFSMRSSVERYEERLAEVVRIVESQTKSAQQAGERKESAA